MDEEIVEPAEVESEEEVIEEESPAETEEETEETEEEPDSEKVEEDPEPTAELSDKEKGLLAKAQDEKRKRQDAEARIENLESKFKEMETRQTAPGQVDEQRLNAYLGELRDEIDTLRLEGRHLEADQKDIDRSALIAEYKKHKERIGEYQQHQTVEQQQARNNEILASKIDDAAVFFAKEKGIPDEVFKSMGEKWQGMMTADPLLARKFVETAQFQGPVSAIEFAHGKVSEVMKAEADEAKANSDKKDAAKKGQVSASGGKVAPAIKSYDKLMEKGSAYVQEYKKNNPKHYAKLHAAAMK